MAIADMSFLNVFSPAGSVSATATMAVGTSGNLFLVPYGEPCCC